MQADEYKWSNDVMHNVLDNQYSGRLTRNGSCVLKKKPKSLALKNVHQNLVLVI